MNWVRRVSKQMRECDNCNDRIFPGSQYFLMVTGERYCEDCEPE